MTQTLDTATIDSYDDRIRAAYRRVIAHQGRRIGDYISLTDLRPEVGGHREHVDEALRRMSRRQVAHLIPQANQKILSQADRAEAVRIGGEPNHLISIR